MNAESLMRPPSTVMRLARMGSFHPTRLSFLRCLLRDLQRDDWRVERVRWDIDAHGVGTAVYTARGQGAAFSLIAFAHDLPPEQRSDRVIATAWDATFCLFDGEPSADDIARLRENVPLQEAGRISARELSLSRANRSVRLFEHVCESLAAGRQPDPAELDAVGYLMRTTAVYGSGKFGAADFDCLAGRAVLDGPFRAEMLSVWLTRAFTVDLVEHLARARGGDRAVALDPALRRRLGVGNSTGLGMAPFLVNHPRLLHRWMAARETALARVRAQASADSEAVDRFASLIARARVNADEWRSAHPLQLDKLQALRTDLAALQSQLAHWDSCGAYPWDALWRWAEERLSLEGQEQLLALMLEPHGALVDDLARQMAIDESLAPIEVGGDCGALRSAIEARADWALAVDFSQPDAGARFWYVSEEKLEPRLGERFEEPGAERELPLDTARALQALHADLCTAGDARALCDFISTHPQHRHTLRRFQLALESPYSAIHDNLTAASVLPLDLLRCKLSFFGASRFDPRSDRWVRVNLFQFAPYPDELHRVDIDDWMWPAAREDAGLTA